MDGTIKIVCNWGKPIGADPAYIMLRWEGDIPEDAQFRIVFIHRKDQRVLYEFHRTKFRIFVKATKY